MASSENYDSTGIEYYTVSNFEFAAGTTKDIKLAYRAFNPSAEKKALVVTCFGGIINTTTTFKDGALKDYHVIVIAMLGNGESSSPSNDNELPSSLQYSDDVNAQYTLLTEHLKIESLDVVVGFSMGGQQVYYWAAMHGSSNDPFVKKAVTICSSAKTSNHNYTFLEGPIAALSTSYDYNGEYKAKGTKPNQGLRAFGRAYAAWLSSAEWYQQELYTQQGAKSLQDYLYPPLGQSSWEQWNPDDLLILARKWQAGNIGKIAGNGDHHEALKGISIPILVMPAETDQYFTPAASQDEVKHLQHGIYAPIQTIWGHLAGGSGSEDDIKWKDDRIKTFLADGK